MNISTLNVAILNCIFFLIPLVTTAQNHVYHAYINLTETDFGKLPINLKRNGSPQQEIHFNFPKSIQGTYSYQNYNRFIELPKSDNIQSYTLNEDVFIIKSTQPIDRICYTVNQSWDKSPNVIFEPASTLFSKEVALLQWWAILPKILNENAKYIIHLEIENDKYITSSTPFTQLNDSVFVSDTLSYEQILDQSLLYSDQETVSFNLEESNLKIQIGSYSTLNKIHPYHLYKDIHETLSTISVYLPKEVFPITYSTLFYFNHKPYKSGKQGALEHKSGAVFTFPESKYEYLKDEIRKTIAHEFLHILNPLVISNTSLQNYDTQNPDIGQQLWFYEGLTEYLAVKLLWQSELISDEQFLEEILQKYNRSLWYDNTVPLSKLSEDVLSEYREQFGNFYNKGFLVSLSLDLFFYQNNSEFTIIELLHILLEKYPEGFEDDKLFSILEKESSVKGVNKFLKSIIQKNDDLPLEEFLFKIGIDFTPIHKIPKASLGNIGIAFKDEKVIVTDVSELDQFGKAIGYQKGDILFSLNNELLTTENFPSKVSEFQNESNSKDTIKIQILRNGKQIHTKAKALINYQEEKASIGLILEEKASFFLFKEHSILQQKD
ncbi:M61 family metallopeptidase [Sediminitomix flava]|uniref:Putative metalloprotease with PDZ domain n=1 Tax=Sediminitomix flava TaxID=379075 RepID=A0A315Z9A5_SEDFL|nr:hypothetical protein [Sediminitomix flava]PWJ42091.1 putative metalloprotease with PDZ domain [Sediminitomix flava]